MGLNAGKGSSTTDSNGYGNQWDDSQYGSEQGTTHSTYGKSSDTGGQTGDTTIKYRTPGAIDEASSYAKNRATGGGGMSDFLLGGSDYGQGGSVGEPGGAAGFYSKAMESGGYDDATKNAITNQGLLALGAKEDAADEEMMRRGNITGNETGLYANMASQGAANAATAANLMRQNQLDFWKEAQREKELGAEGSSRLLALNNAATQNAANQWGSLGSLGGGSSSTGTHYGESSTEGGGAANTTTQGTTARQGGTENANHQKTTFANQSGSGDVNGDFLGSLLKGLGLTGGSSKPSGGSPGGNAPSGQNPGAGRPSGNPTGPFTNPNGSPNLGGMPGYSPGYSTDANGNYIYTDEDGNSYAWNEDTQDWDTYYSPDEMYGPWQGEGEDYGPWYDSSGDYQPGDEFYGPWYDSSGDYQPGDEFYGPWAGDTGGYYDPGPDDSWDWGGGW